MVGHGLGVVPGAGRHDSLLSLFFGELEEFVQSPPILERSGALKVLELPEELAGHLVLEGLGALAGGLDDPVANPPSGGMDISELHHDSLTWEFARSGAAVLPGQVPGLRRYWSRPIFKIFSSSSGLSFFSRREPIPRGERELAPRRLTARSSRMGVPE